MKHISHHSSAHPLLAAQGLKSPVVLEISLEEQVQGEKWSCHPLQVFYYLSSMLTQDRKLHILQPRWQSIIDNVPGAQVEK